MLDAGAAAGWRRARAQRALARLGQDVATWAATVDAPGRASQLAAIRGAVDAMLAHLTPAAAALGADPAALAAAARVERDAIVAERLWRHYADRLAQRRGPGAAALAAADELIWSCVAVARAVTGAALPYPLAFAEAAYAPSALPRDARPAELAPVDRALAAVLHAMPVPLIALPTAFAAEPWWLILAAHEVGHLVQLEAEPGDAIGARTEAAIAPHAPDLLDAQREIFADAFAVAAVGPAAIRAMAELEWGTPAEMAAPRPGYPSVARRLAIMAAVGRALGQAVDPELVPARDGAAPTASTEAHPEAAALAAALIELPIGTGTLRAVAAACDSATDDAACARVLAGADLGLVPGRARPLRAIAAAFRAYARLQAEPDEGRRATAAAALATRVVRLIADVRDPEIRRAAGADAPPPASAPSAAHARVLAALRAGDAP